jgi:hypothetical protein
MHKGVANVSKRILLTSMMHLGDGDELNLVGLQRV